MREYVEAMGGKLSLIAEFRDREPVLLSGIAEEEERERPQETEPWRPKKRRYKAIKVRLGRLLAQLPRFFDRSLVSCGVRGAFSDYLPVASA